MGRCFSNEGTNTRQRTSSTSSSICRGPHFYDYFIDFMIFSRLFCGKTPSTLSHCWLLDTGRAIDTTLDAVEAKEPQCCFSRFSSFGVSQSRAHHTNNTRGPTEVESFSGPRRTTDRRRDAAQRGGGKFGFFSASAVRRSSSWLSSIHKVAPR